MSPAPHRSRPSDPRAWLGALAPRLGTVVRCHLPGSPIDSRRRELVAGVVSAALGHDGLASMHAAWHDLLGPAELTEIDDELLSWAVAAARSGPAVIDAATLPDEVDPRTRRALVALVVHGAVVANTIDAGESLLDRIRRRAPISITDGATDLALLAVAIPVVAPTLVMGAAATVLGRVVPPAPPIRLAEDPNLLSQLLAEALPLWFGGAVGRTLVSRLPVEVPIAIRSGRTGATVRIGRGEVTIHNGVADGVWALFDGEIDGLLRAGTGSLSREVRAAGLRR